MTIIRLFLANSGAEASENAIKLASFATGRSQDPCLRQGVFTDAHQPQLPPPTTPAYRLQSTRPTTSSSPLNDIEAATRLLESQEFAAVIIEGIQELQESAWSMMISCAA